MTDVWYSEEHNELFLAERLTLDMVCFYATDGQGYLLSPRQLDYYFHYIGEL